MFEGNEKDLAEKLLKVRQRVYHMIQEWLFWPFWDRFWDHFSTSTFIPKPVLIRTRGLTRCTFFVQSREKLCAYCDAVSSSSEADGDEMPEQQHNKLFQYAHEIASLVKELLNRESA